MALNIPMPNQPILGAKTDAVSQVQTGAANNSVGLANQFAGGAAANKTNTRAVGQQVAAQQVSQQGQLVQQATEQATKNLAQQGQLALGEQKIAQNQQLFIRQQSANKKQRQMEDDLFQMDRAAKSELLDKQLSFKRDQAGNALWTEQQLADWAVTKAKSRAELESWARTMTFETNRKSQILAAAQNVLLSALKNQSDATNQALNQQQTMRIAEAARAAKEKMMKQKNKAANNAAIIQGVFMVGGAVAGSLAGPGVGTAAGASLGAGVGSIVASQTADKV